MRKELTAPTKPHLSGEDINTQQRMPGCVGLLPRDTSRHDVLDGLAGESEHAGQVCVEGGRSSVNTKLCIYTIKNSGHPVAGSRTDCSLE